MNKNVCIRNNKILIHFYVNQLQLVVYLYVYRSINDSEEHENFYKRNIF